MAETALLVVDMFNTYGREDADTLAGNVAEIVSPLADLIARARRRDNVDLIYVNDNHGDFTAQSGDMIAAALNGARPDLVRPIVPEKGCRVLTKVLPSVFYATALDYLLGRLGTTRVNPDRAGHRAVHLLQRTGRLCAPLRRRGAAGRGGPHRSGPGEGGAGDDAAQHERRRLTCPGLSGMTFGCPPAR